MSIAVVLITLVLLVAVVALIGSPLRTRAQQRAGDSADAADEQRRADRARLAREQLEAAREAKYREIRDAELDFRTGKLSEQDYAAVDRALRAEAGEILRRLDAADDGERRERPSTRD